MQCDRNTPLFRIENPNIYNQPDGIIWGEEVRGQWFYPDIGYMRGYIRQVVNLRGGIPVEGATFPYEDSPAVDGARLVIAQVPLQVLPLYRAEVHPVASRMAYNPLDYIIPRDGSVPITELSLDVALGSLRRNLYAKDSLDMAQTKIELLAQNALIESDL
jgi:hypothetical protein